MDIMDIAIIGIFSRFIEKDSTAIEYEALVIYIIRNSNVVVINKPKYLYILF